MVQSLEIRSSGRVFPPGKLLCIGRNYAMHAAEMKAAIPTEPMVFLKPASALVRSGESIVLPARSADVHHEVELVVLIGREVRNVRSEDALEAVAGYAVGLDMTARDLQAAAKKSGSPWTVAKGFDTFAPVGEFLDAAAVADPGRLEISLEVNGSIRQSGNTSNMIFSVEELIAYCSTIFTLVPGDLIYTGTPEGVGQVKQGDRLRASASGLPDLVVDVRSETGQG
jgi:2-keto-4-pentenoate hydratase/2-oxohepta-3-ene-1,7-dioic acid hydratase in catechol pathway